MAIITITRGSLRAAERFGERLAEKLGYRRVTREEVIQHAERWGIQGLRLADSATFSKQPPTLWDRHVAQRCHYLTVYRASLMDFVVQDNLIYDGHLGQYLLFGVPDLLRIRVDADIEFRIKMHIEESGRTRAEAEAYIADMDRRRERWVRFLYGAAYGDLVNYDLIFNMARMNTETMTDLVAQLVDRPPFSQSEDIAKVLKAMHFKSDIEAHLVSSARTRGMTLEVSADPASGKITITGPQPMMGTEIWERDIRGVLSEVENVKEIEILTE